MLGAAVAVFVVSAVLATTLVTLMWSDPVRELTPWWWRMVTLLAVSLVAYVVVVLLFLAAMGRSRT